MRRALALGPFRATPLRSLLFAASIPGSSPHLALRRVSTRIPRAPRACASEPLPPGFATLGLSPLLQPALEAAGITEPTEVQQTAFGAILDGGDTVLLSETGSGKTLAYALPIIDRLIRRVDGETGSSRGADGADGDESAAAATGVGEPTARKRRRDDQVLVLVPNSMLCAQVHTVFRRLIESLPDGLDRRLSVTSLASEESFDNDATILISTPAVALRMWRGPESVRTVVLDEADALLAGSFKPAARSTYPIEILIAAVKRSAKEEAMATGESLGGRRGPEGRLARARAYDSKQVGREE